MPMPIAKPASYLAYVAVVALMAAPSWLILVALVHQPPSDPPPIAGATEDEQRGPAVRRGFALGKQYRPTLLNSHADSWLAAAGRLEQGRPWQEVQDTWSEADRPWRDEPFRRVVAPEIAKILGSTSPNDPEHARVATLFLRAFAAGLKDTGR